MWKSFCGIMVQEFFFGVKCFLIKKIYTRKKNTLNQKCLWKFSCKKMLSGKSVWVKKFSKKKYFIKDFLKPFFMWIFCLLWLFCVGIFFWVFFLTIRVWVGFFSEWEFYSVLSLPFELELCCYFSFVIFLIFKVATIWVLAFCHNLCFWVLKQVDFLLTCFCRKLNFCEL